MGRMDATYSGVSSILITFSDAITFSKDFVHTVVVDLDIFKENVLL
jgi:hypothetical protein